jgi:hypothetical protein
MTRYLYTVGTYHPDDGHVLGGEGGVLHLRRLDREQGDGEDQRIKPHVHACKKSR